MNPNLPYYKNTILRQDFCPKCYNMVNWLLDSKINSILPTCKKCEWTGQWDECLDEDEAKNLRRIKIIDKALEEIQRD